MQILVTIDHIEIVSYYTPNDLFLQLPFTVNINNVVGSIGFVSRIIPSVYPISIIKADPDTGEPIRDKNGLCQVNY